MGIVGNRKFKIESRESKIERKRELQIVSRKKPKIEKRDAYLAFIFNNYNKKGFQTSSENLFLLHAR